MAEVGRIRRSARTNAAPRPAIGELRRKANMPAFNIDVGDPAELSDQQPQQGGIDLSSLIDLNPESFAQEPALTSDDDPFYDNLLGAKGGVSVSEVQSVVRHLDQLFERDIEARKNQDKIIARGIQETGYDRNDDVRTTPFPGASAVVHPMFAQAATDFSSRTIRQLFPSKGPVKTSIEGVQSEDDLTRAAKVRRFMNWILMKRCRSYRGETDKMLTMLPFAGDCLKKLYWEPTEDGFGRPKPEFVLAEKFICPYGTTDLAETPRYAHDLDLWPERVDELMDSGEWIKTKLPRGAGGRQQKAQQRTRSDKLLGLEDTADLDDGTMGFRECHIDWYFPTLKEANDAARKAASQAPQQQQPQAPANPNEPPQQDNVLPFPGGQPPASAGAFDMVDVGQQQSPKPETDPDAVSANEVKEAEREEMNAARNAATPGFPIGPKLSYVLTYHIDSLEPVALRRNWKKSDANQKKRVWFSHYVMFAWRSWNGLGLWHLIGGLAKAATGTLRAFMDSLIIDNMPGGVRLANNRMSGDDISYRPMQFAKIQAPGADDIKKILMPYPKNPTSPLMFQLLEAIVGWGLNFATTATQEIVDMAPNTPATTVLNIIEHAGAVYSAIHARLHAAQEREFELLAELVAENLPPEGFAFSDEQGEETVTRDDFKNVKISPVSDPDTFSELQRAIKAQAAVELALKARDVGVNVDLRFVFTFYAETIGLPDIDKIFPQAQNAIPRDPVSELFALVKGAPVDAFPGQNHKAHLAFMTAATEHPTYSQMIQPVMPAFMALAQAHAMWALRDDIENGNANPLPLNDNTLNQQQQFEIAQSCAEIMQELLEKATNGEGYQAAPYPQPGMTGQAGPTGADLLKAEQIKAGVQRERTSATLNAKAQEGRRKLAETQATLEASEREEIFKQHQEDMRDRRRVAADLTKHFATLAHEQNVAANEHERFIVDNVNKIIEAIFGKITDHAHDIAEASRGRRHELTTHAMTLGHQAREGVRERAHDAEQALLDRAHQGDMAAATARRTDGNE